MINDTGFQFSCLLWHIDVEDVKRNVSCRMVKATYETVVISFRPHSVAEGTGSWYKGFYDLEVSNLIIIGPN
jgi:hypothetical protein